MICNSASGCGAPPRPSRRLSLTTVIHRYAGRVTFRRFGEILNLHTMYLDGTNVVVFLRTKEMFFHLCSLFLMPLVHAMTSAMRDLIASTKKWGAGPSCSGGNKDKMSSHPTCWPRSMGPEREKGAMYMSRVRPCVEGLLEANA